MQSRPVVIKRPLTCNVVVTIQVAAACNEIHACAFAWLASVSSPLLDPWVRATSLTIPTCYILAAAVLGFLVWYVLVVRALLHMLG